MLRKVLTIFWILATCVGAGVGWYWGSTSESWFVAALPLAICQGVVLLFTGKWRLALLWVAATNAGWWVFILVGALLGGTCSLGVLWATWKGDIGVAFAFLPILGIPLVAYAQSLVLSFWVVSERKLYWFGVSVFSFLVMGFLALVVHDPRDSYFNTIPPVSITFWLLGALWGACTGWVLFGIRELGGSSPSARREGVYRHRAGRSSAPSQYPSASDTYPSED